MHLMINMFVLYSFGGIVEGTFKNCFDAKGYLYYGLLYVGAVFMSVVPSFEKHKKNPSYNAVGASGAVSAVVFSSIIFDPMGKIGFMFLPFAMPSFVFGLLYLVYSAYMSRKGTDNIGHDAHFFGALFGMMFTIAIKPELFMSFIHQIQAYFIN
jgi:membrane associated rhomboid family serine protease